MSQEKKKLEEVVKKMAAVMKAAREASKEKSGSAKSREVKRKE